MNKATINNGLNMLGGEVRTILEGKKLSVGDINQVIEYAKHFGYAYVDGVGKYLIYNAYHGLYHFENK